MEFSSVPGDLLLCLFQLTSILYFNKKIPLRPALTWLTAGLRGTWVQVSFSLGWHCCCCIRIRIQLSEISLVSTFLPSCCKDIIYAYFARACAAVIIVYHQYGKMFIGAYISLTKIPWTHFSPAFGIGLKLKKAISSTEQQRHK